MIAILSWQLIWAPIRQPFHHTKYFDDLKEVPVSPKGGESWASPYVTFRPRAITFHALSVSRAAGALKLLYNDLFCENRNTCRMDLSLLEGPPCRDSRFYPVRSSKPITSPAFDLSSWDDGLHIDYRYPTSPVSQSTTRVQRRSPPYHSNAKRLIHNPREESLVSYNLRWFDEPQVWMKRYPSQSPCNLRPPKKNTHIEYYGKLEDMDSRSEWALFQGHFSANQHISDDSPPSYESHTFSRYEASRTTAPPSSFLTVAQRLGQYTRPRGCHWPRYILQSVRMSQHWRSLCRSFAIWLGLFERSFTYRFGIARWMYQSAFFLLF